jgi:predicted Ser/Thr protein kinase
LGKDYNIEKLIGEGNFGKVYSTCKLKNCDYVLKVDEFSIKMFKAKENKDGIMGKVAGEFGVGPEVYDYGECKNKDGNYVSWTLMERIYGNMLSDTYPYNPNQVVKAIYKYYRLLRVTGIAQSDLKGQNIMVTKNGKVYIVDYGIALKVNYTKEDIRRHMSSNMIPYLIYSLTKGNVHWSEDTPKNRTRVLSDIFNAINKWVEKKIGSYYKLNFDKIESQLHKI